MLFSFDKFDRYEIPVLTVAHPDFTKVGIIKDPIGLKLDLNLVSTSKASFEAYSVDDTGNATFYYGALTKYNLVHISGFGWFVITHVDESNDGIHKSKSVDCESYEYTLGRKAANLSAGTYRLYDPSNAASTETLLGHFLANCPRWTIGYVSSALYSRYRTFDMPDASMYGFLMEEAMDAYECVFVFDTENLQIKVYAPDDLIKDSGIVFRYTSLLKHISISDSADDVVTELQVYGADNFSIATVNPLGTASIYKYDYFKDVMPAAMWVKVKQWQDDVAAAMGRTSAYGNILTAIKNENLKILGYEANKSEVERYRAAGEQVRTVNTPYTMQAVSQTAVDNIRAWIDSKNSTDLLTMVTAADAYPPIPTFVPAGGEGVVPSEIQAYADTITEADRNVAQATVNIYACEKCEKYCDSLIATSKAQIEIYQNQRKATHTNLSISNYLTADEIVALGDYTLADVYENPYIVPLDGMTYEETQNLAFELLDDAFETLERVSQPTFDFSVETVNLMFDKEHEDYVNIIEQNGLGCRVHVEFEDGHWYNPVLMGISVEYDAPDKCELVFGSNYHAKMSEDLYAECFQQAAKTSATVSSALHSWLNPMESQSLSPMREFMEGALNAAVNKIINSNNQSTVIDQFGIWGRKITDDGYSPKQIKIINNGLYMTDDNWDTCKLALGEIDIPGAADSAYGIASEVLIGNLILGEALKIMNANNTFTIDENGVNLTTSDGLKKIYINPSDGFKIQGRADTTSAFADKLYLDSEGNAILRDITAVGGTFAGGVLADSGTMGAFFSTGDSNKVLGNLTIEGDLTINGKYPASPVTPAGAGINYGSNGYLVTAPTANSFGTMEVETLAVTDGNTTWYLRQNGSQTTGSGGGSTGGSGSGTSYNIIRFTSSTTVYIHSDTSTTHSSNSKGKMQSGTWYVYDSMTSNSHGMWYWITRTCTYRNGQVSNVQPTTSGWVNLDASLPTVDSYINVPGV